MSAYATQQREQDKAKAIDMILGHIETGRAITIREITNTGGTSINRRRSSIKVFVVQPNGYKIDITTKAHEAIFGLASWQYSPHKHTISIPGPEADKLTMLAQALSTACYGGEGKLAYRTLPLAA